MSLSNPPKTGLIADGSGNFLGIDSNNTLFEISGTFG
jgi:hypothetical protein